MIEKIDYYKQLILLFIFWFSWEVIGNILPRAYTGVLVSFHSIFLIIMSIVILRARSNHVNFFLALGYLLTGFSDLLWAFNAYFLSNTCRSWVGLTDSFLIGLSFLSFSYGLLRIVPNLTTFIKKTLPGSILTTALILSMIGVVPFESAQSDIFPYFYGVELFSGLSSLILILVSSMFMVGAMSLHWSIIGCSFFNFAVGDLSIKVDKILYDTVRFDFYSVLFSVGIYMSLFRLYQNTDDSFYTTKYDVKKSIFVSYKNSALFILFLMLLLFLLSQNGDIDARRTIISISCLTAYAVIFVNKYLANNIVENSVKLTELLSDPQAGVSILDSSIPMEIRTYYTSMMEATLKEKRIAADYEAKSQLAHNISSPIEVQCSILEGKQTLSREETKLLRKSAENMKDMVKVTRNWKSQFSNRYHEEQISLNSLLSLVISHKSVEYKKCQIKFSFHDSCNGSVFVNGSESQLFSILSNLVNNAVEALEDHIGSVNLILTPRSNTCEIHLLDNGKGIPKELLSSVTLHGFSTKPKGQGIGLSHAKVTLEKMGGKMDICSDGKSYTSIKIVLPLCEPPRWYVHLLEFDARGKVIVIDDSRDQHQLVRELLKPYNLTSVNYHDYEEFKENLSSLSQYDHILVDYQLSSKITGTEIIERHNLKERAILVTSYADEHEIRKYCSEKGIRMIPKERLAKKNIFVHHQAAELNSKEFDAIIIDDQQTILEYCEQKAANSLLKIKCYENVVHFFTDATQINKNATVYIDCNLGYGMSGLNVSRTIREVYGFKKIYLTSVDKIDIQGLDWIDGFIAKKELITLKLNGTDHTHKEQ